MLYGGLMIPGENAKLLSVEVDDIRREFGVDANFKLKFNPGPNGMVHLTFASLKQRLIEAAIRHGAKLIVYLILHDIARSPDEARRNGINSVSYHFDCLMNRLGGPGIVLIDRFNDQGNQIEAHLTQKFSMGVNLPYTPQARLQNILGFHYSSIGQSHFPSLIDVILGSFRFAVNAHTRAMNGHLETAHNILRMLEPLFFREPTNGPVSELSIFFSPKIINVATYREKYQSLKDFLSSVGINTAQPITDQRQY